MFKRIIFCVLASGTLALCGAAAALNLVVTNSADSGVGSLRDTLEQARFGAHDAVNITFAEGVTHIVVPTSLGVGNTLYPVTLDGGGKVVLDGNQTGPVGLEISGVDVTVRGMKLISFTFAGIVVLTSAEDAHIVGCMLGTDGNAVHGNAAGVVVLGGTGVVIGGPGADRNVLSGNSEAGIRLEQSAAGVTIQGNYIGTTPDGLLPMANGTGIRAITGSGHLIGGADPGQGNVCSGNTMAGIEVSGPTTSATLESNIVGLDKDADASIPNGIYGVVVASASNVTVGGAGAGNVISGNVNSGLYLVNASALTVQGNFIGLDGTGTVARPNAKGIEGYGPVEVLLGGTGAGEGNVISGNQGNGVDLPGSSTATIQGNVVGRSPQSTIALGNGGAGIFVGGKGTIGGLSQEAANIVANNTGPGVVFLAGTATTVRRNAIFDNGDVGIFVQVSGTSAVSSPVISGVGPIAGDAPALSTVEFFADGGGEGKIYVGSAPVDGQGHFSSNISVAAFSGLVLTATATTNTANPETSAFSLPYPIPLVDRPHDADQNGDLVVDLSELLRVIQFYNSSGISCALPADSTEDGFAPGLAGNHTCAPHSSDYSPQDWTISLSELLRVIQIYNVGGYFVCVGGEDGFCPLIALP